MMPQCIWRTIIWATTAAFPVALAALVAQLPTDAAIDAGAQIRSRYAMTPNITYLTANNFEVKLDVYSRIDSKAPVPTLIFIHGGGWVGLNKEYAITAFIPWLMMGWNVVNVEYRLAKVSLAPAAVEDCLCALRWTITNAAKYHFDPQRIVVAGESAGGHLALTTGMIPESAGLDRECPGERLPHVAAIVDWFGVSDVNELLRGENERDYAVAWFGSTQNADKLAHRVSPLTYVRPGLPPVFIIHGDADPVVPYSQSARLHKALDGVDVPNVLHTVHGGSHGHFTPKEQIQIYRELQNFLIEQGIQISP